jgi:hypothetical protein
VADLTPEELSQLLDYPTQAPPPGVTPNFNNPHSIAYQVYITAGFCIILMIVFSLIRVMAKARSSTRNINHSDESKVSYPTDGSPLTRRLVSCLFYRIGKI